MISETESVLGLMVVEKVNRPSSRRPSKNNSRGVGTNGGMSNQELKLYKHEPRYEYSDQQRESKGQ